MHRAEVTLESSWAPPSPNLFGLLGSWKSSLTLSSSKACGAGETPRLFPKRVSYAERQMLNTSGCSDRRPWERILSGEALETLPSTAGFVLPGLDPVLHCGKTLPRCLSFFILSHDERPNASTSEADLSPWLILGATFRAGVWPGG